MNCISKQYRLFCTSIKKAAEDPRFSSIKEELLELKSLFNPQFVFTHLMTRENHNSTEELERHVCDMLGKDECPRLSSFTQVLYKYKPEVFDALFKYMVDSQSKISDETFQGLSLKMYDGTKVNLPNDPSQKDYHYPHKKRKKKGSGTKTPGKGYNQLHLTAAYDYYNHIFSAFITQPGRKTDERKAMYDLVKEDRRDAARKAGSTEEEISTSDLHIADRGFESYALICSLLMMNEVFLIRGRDITSNGIAASIPKQDSDTFDMVWDIILTRSRTRETLEEHPELYKILNKNQWKLDLKGLSEYHLKLRIVRVDLGNGNYEVLLTNLDQDKFSPEDLKTLYNYRWAQEVAFRQLKYQVDLAFIHHRNIEYIEMEIAARMMFFNICGAVYTSLKDKAPEGRQLNFAYLVTQVRRCFQQNGSRAVWFAKKIVKNTIPVRKNRKFPRDVRPQNFRAYTNRG